ncbi:DUF3224 domain-containing protein [Kangiella profundi]|uniref:DUF3224 domain-containing protein n=1 Tax=Kangiella profundi TaxID=1561924 RepID=A0A2K9AUC4_9GAMM|nr:DUF3224 domain-containing protein [Kangiella profundi]AUD80023.1 DUF3224 domain-containing protein [Kangiella profundi]
MQINGSFTVTLNPLESNINGTDSMTFRRMSIEKEFSGPLEATSNGEMLSIMTPIKGSAGYVAIEQVVGSLEGKQGSFVLQHYGVMELGAEKLTLEVIPDSGVGELAGLSGQMNIYIEDGKHFYEFDYQLP